MARTTQFANSALGAGKPSNALYGSDLMVEMLRPESWRQLPRSTRLAGELWRGRARDTMCAHEEFAVAMANGYARVTGKPMATGLHNVVGLQHASMAIFNAWCDRTPMLNLGGGGPQDATHRRSTDWVHDVPSLGVPLGPSVRERGALQPAIGPDTVVIHITLYDLEKQSWVTDNMWMMPVSVPIAADTAQAIPELVRLCRERLMSSTGSADRVEQRRVRVHAMHRQAREEADAWTQQVWDQEPHIFGPALW